MDIKFENCQPFSHMFNQLGSKFIYDNAMPISVLTDDKLYRPSLVTIDFSLCYILNMPYELALNKINMWLV